jgi:hypothetical protein
MQSSLRMLGPYGLMVATENPQSDQSHASARAVHGKA